MSQAQDFFSIPDYFKGKSCFNDFEKLVLSNYPKTIPRRGLSKVKNLVKAEKKIISDAEVISMVGGIKNMKKYSFTPDQIAELLGDIPITIERNHSCPIYLPCNSDHIFYCLGKDNQLFSLCIHMRGDDYGGEYLHLTARVSRVNLKKDTTVNRLEAFSYSYIHPCYVWVNVP